MDPDVQRRFFHLRNQLSALNYSCNFGLDAMDVVNELFTDLVATTESYSQLQEKHSKLSLDLATAQAHLLPLRKDIGRLSRENHQLHLDSIHIKEDAAEQLSRMTARCQKLELECAELKQVCDLKEAEMLKHEAERQRLRSAYESLAAQSISGGGVKVKRGIKVTQPLPPNPPPPPATSTLDDAASVGTPIDSASPAERAVLQSLNAKIQELTVRLRSQESENEKLRDSVRRREQELGRNILSMTENSIRGNIFDPNDPNGKIELLTMTNGANERIIDQLNGQVDFLNAQLATREAQLAEMLDKSKTLEEVQLEYENCQKLLASSREDNVVLVAELRDLESKFEELNRLTEPESNLNSGGGEANQNEPSQAVNYSNTSDISTSTSSSSSSSSSAYNRLARTVSKYSGKRSTAQQDQNSQRHGVSASASNTQSKNAEAELARLTSELSVRASDLNQTRQALSGLQSEEALQRLKTMRTEERLDKLKEELDRSRGEANSVSSQLQLRIAEVQALQLERDELAASLASARSSLKERADRLNAVEGKSFAVDGALARLEREKAYLDDALAALANEASALRRDKLMLNAQVDTTSAELTGLKLERDTLVASVKSLTEELSQSRSSVVLLGNDTQKAKDELAAAQGTVRQLQQRCGDLESRLTTTSAELSRSASAQAQLEAALKVVQSTLDQDGGSGSGSGSAGIGGADRSVSAVSPGYTHGGASRQTPPHRSSVNNTATAVYDSPASVHSEISSNASVASGSAASMASALQVRARLAEASALRAQLIAEQEKCQRLTEESSQLQSQLAIARAEAASSNSRAEALRSDMSELVNTLEQRERALGQVQSQCSALKSELARLTSQINTRDATYDALSLADRDRVQRIESLSGSLDAVSAENRALRKRIDDLEKDVDANRRMAEDAMADAESAVGRVSIAERTAESSMLAKSEAVRQLNACQQRLADLERQLGDAQRSLDKCRSESRELQSERDALRAKTAELKSLVDSLDGSYKDGGARLSRALMAIDEHKSAIQRLESSNSSLQQQIRERDDRIASLVRSLSDIDMDRDNLQAQLDARDEAASASDDVRVRAERAVEDYRVRLSESELKIRMLNDELASSRRQAAVTDGRIATLKAELEECQRRFNMSYSEMNHAAEELRLMTSENQAITSELAQVSYERDRLRERVTELGVVASSEQDARRALEVERADLLTAYRQALQQKRRLETDLAALASTKQRMAMSLQQLHSDAAELRAQLSNKNSSLDREAFDRAALLSQIEALNSQLVSASQTQEGIEADNRRLMQELYSERTQNSMLTERVAALLKRAASASDATKVMSSRLAAVERERDAMRSLAAMERQKASELGSVVEISRAQAATASAQLNRYRQVVVNAATSREAEEPGESNNQSNSYSANSNSNINSSSGNSSSNGSSSSKDMAYPPSATNTTSASKVGAGANDRSANATTTATGYGASSSNAISDAATSVVRGDADIIDIDTGNADDAIDDFNTTSHGANDSSSSHSRSILEGGDVLVASTTTMTSQHLQENTDSNATTTHASASARTTISTRKNAKSSDYAVKAGMETTSTSTTSARETAAATSISTSSTKKVTNSSSSSSSNRSGSSSSKTSLPPSLSALLSALPPSSPSPSTYASGSGSGRNSSGIGTNHMSSSKGVTSAGMLASSSRKGDALLDAELGISDED